ncbi:MAG TPA: hypothetical protein VF158_07160 [Longimicrobiales bacterium]
MDDLRRDIEDWTLSSAYPPLAALVAFLLAAAAALFPGEIGSATREFLQRLAAFDAGGRPALWVAAFWAALAAFSVLLYFRLRAEEWRNGERMRKMLQAVHRSPSPNVFIDYPRLFRQAEGTVKALALTGDAPARREAALQAIHAVLTHVIALARYFARAPEGDLRARIFLIAEPGPEGTDPYAPALVERLRFFDHDRHRLEGLRALLYLPADLAGTDEPDAAGAVRLALPVPHRAETPHGHRLALPGAPYTLLTGEPGIYEDTRALPPETCADLEKSVRDEIERYYAKGGDGSDIRSMVSVRIGHETNPVGVLELVSRRPLVLGHEPEYYVTFFALAEPLIRLLTEPVAAYQAAAHELLLLPGTPAAPAAVPAPADEKPVTAGHRRR